MPNAQPPASMDGPGGVEEAAIRDVRVSAWFDTNTFEKKHGVQVFVPGRGWLHLAVGGVAAIFDTAEEAKAQADEVKQQASLANRPEGGGDGR
ncbi:hypothetical protein SAMN02745194_04514 [Roseomonas rosea]|uniref:Uncharacterized protein n=1 Tax=Muricoccus roseus TaxID=198092 RepID=A0A1M6QUA0_9PROT|nr:hypothetical protein [Roseomonas rosea]SHK23678.1 hypothetical protein SAMN02745194_04514 [Roseomonas rosea]